MLDLMAAPFNLMTEDVNWVESTLLSMDMKAKVGQVFCMVGRRPNLAEIANLQDLVQPGAFMFRPNKAADIQKAHRFLQDRSDIPLLLAANLERGGSGIAIEGTNFASFMQVAATRDPEMAYRLGVVCGREGRAVGCNWTYSPVIDIDYNFQNPITNTRTFGSDPDLVLSLACAYMKGIQENGIAATIKHFPGDGVDGRDQHLLTSINSFSIEEWSSTYGKIYRGMIAAGAKSAMVGHIMQPAWSRRLKPGILDQEIMPASLAPELLNGLLRQELEFNGLIVTDATNMAGFTSLMPREKAVPYSIAAGCDMFLFTISPNEDFEFMLEGVRSGILPMERLEDAVRRILALKASLKLPRQKAEGTLVPDDNALSAVASTEYKIWARDCADKAITLVKDTQALLPLSPAKYKRILVYVLGDSGGYLDVNAKSSSNRFIEKLETEGFSVTKHEYDGLSAEEQASVTTTPVRQLKDNFDLILYYASIKTASNQTVVRITWSQPMGSDVPKFISEIPTAFISVDNPYHLQDVPRIKTYVNGYTGTDEVVDAVIDKLMGRSPFRGISPVDPFCGYWEARL